MNTAPPIAPPPASATALPSPITIKGRPYAALGITWTDSPGQKRLEAHIYYPRAHTPLILWVGAEYTANQEWTTATALSRIQALQASGDLDKCF